jgi:hypothetical protein
MSSMDRDIERNEYKETSSCIQLEFELHTVFVRCSLISSSMVVGSGSSMQRQTTLYQIIKLAQTIVESF